MATRAKKAERRERRAERRAIRASGLDPNGQEFAIVGAVRIEAAADGENGPSAAPATITAYTGGVLDLPGFRHPVVVELQSASFRREVTPLLRDHDPTKVVGSGRGTISASGIEIEGTISAATEYGREAIALARDGFPWESSIGGKGKLHLVAKGKSVQVNGQSFDGPLYVAKGFVVQENSLVASGADVGGTTVNIAASANGDDPMFEKWLQARGIDPATLNDERREELSAEFEAAVLATATTSQTPPPAATPAPEPQPEPTPVHAAGTITAAMRAEAAAEQQRIDDIRQRVQASGVERITVGGAEVNAAAHAISEGWTPERAELECLRASRTTGPNIGRSRHAEDMSNTDAIEASLLRSYAGWGEEQLRGVGYGDAVLEASDRLGHFGLQRLMFTTIEAAGMYSPFGAVNNDTIRTFLEAETRLQASSGTMGFSLQTATGILSNLAGKRMLAAFRAHQVVAPIIARSRPVRDFKEHNSYRLNIQGDFEETGAGGELKQGALIESVHPNRAKTHGQVVTLTRQDMINDDLGAFDSLAAGLGRKAALKLDKVGMSLISNAENAGFCTAAKGNKITLVLGIPGLTAARKAFEESSDIAGDPIGIDPTILLTPPAGAVTGENLFRGNQVVVERRISDGTPAITAPNINNFVGLYQPVTSRLLAAAKGLPGASDTAWWLTTREGDAAPIEIAYLNGVQVPTIESEQTRADILGMMWRAYFDFGVAYGDDQAIVMSDGTTQPS